MAAVHLLWTEAKEEVSEVEEEDVGVVVEGMSVFRIKKDNARSEIAVDSHTRVLVLVVQAVSGEVEVTVALKELEDHVLRPMVDSRELWEVTASKWEDCLLLEVIPNKEVRQVTVRVNQVATVIEEVCQVGTVVRVHSQVITAAWLAHKLANQVVLTVIVVVMLRGRRAGINSR